MLHKRIGFHGFVDVRHVRDIIDAEDHFEILLGRHRGERRHEFPELELELGELRIAPGRQAFLVDSYDQGCAGGLVRRRRLYEDVHIAEIVGVFEVSPLEVQGGPFARACRCLEQEIRPRTDAA